MRFDHTYTFRTIGPLLEIIRMLHRHHLWPASA